MTQKNLYPQEISLLENQLDNFNSQIRKDSLLKLHHMAESGALDLPEQTETANLHCHTFYSFNGYGYSPSHIAWLGRKLGAKFMGIIDFDVLDGVDEFLDACEMVGMRGTAGIETRVFIPEFSQVEINSPGEPGVAYHMGTGFVSSQVPQSAEPALMDIRQRAEQRNLGIIDKVNAFLNPLKLDYETEILPFTPAGNVTERHMVEKIAQKSIQDIGDPVRFWSEKLHLPEEEVSKTMENSNTFNNLLRSRLMKRGGISYVQPDRSTFPVLDDFHEIILSANAIPCSAWLDGTSAGEQMMESLLDLLISRGVATLNIIPDRNWNIANPEVKAHKVKELHKIVKLAQALDLPILVGTEMNAYGQKLMDVFDSPELAPFNEVFMEGAYFLYGHTWLARHAQMGYQSDWSNKHFSERKSKNTFFQAVGRIADPKIDSALYASAITPELNPDQVLDTFRSNS